MAACIIFITGGPGSGKSTTSRLLAEHFSHSFHLRVDELREGMVRGFEPPSMPFTDGVRAQFRMARRAAALMAPVYADAGVTIVIDDAPVPEDFADEYAQLFADPRVVRIMLAADGPTMVARMRARNGPFDEFLVGLGADFLSEWMVNTPKDGWVVVDNSELTVEQTVARVLASIAAPPSE